MKCRGHVSDPYMDAYSDGGIVSAEDRTTLVCKEGKVAWLKPAANTDTLHDLHNARLMLMMVATLPHGCLGLLRLS